MARRLALAAVALACLAPSIWARLRPSPRPAGPCEPEGRGVPPRHWIGCRADRGPRRALDGRERVLLGLPVDLNEASADDLAAVPGLTPALATEVVADRARRGPFASPDDLLRVRGIGPARLARARPLLRAGAGP